MAEVTTRGLDVAKRSSGFMVPIRLESQACE